VKEQNQALAKAQLAAQEAEAAARAAAERCRALDQEAAALRQQLQHSDELRYQGQKALADLRDQFEDLTRDIAEGAGAVSDEGSPQPHSMHADPGPVILEMRSDSRVANLLERLADESVMSRLEQCLDKLSTA